MVLGRSRVAKGAWLMIECRGLSVAWSSATKRSAVVGTTAVMPYCITTAE